MVPRLAIAVDAYPCNPFLKSSVRNLGSLVSFAKARSGRYRGYGPATGSPVNAGEEFFAGVVRLYWIEWILGVGWR